MVIEMERIIEAVEADDNLGFCVACGEEAESCEPDARQYECECLRGESGLRCRGTHARRGCSMIQIVYNRLLCGWYVVRGVHQTPICGRFETKADAQAWLSRSTNGAKK
jgi:hypothetical protein